MERLITREEAAQLLSVNVRLVDKWIREGKIEIVRHGRKVVRIEQAELRRFIESGKEQKHDAENGSGKVGQ